MEMLFFMRHELNELFADFADMLVVKMSLAQDQWSDDDWLVYLTK